MLTDYENLKTVGDWLDWLHDQLNNHRLYFGHGTDNAWDEAVQMVLCVAQLPLDSGDEVLELELQPRQSEKLVQLAEQRIFSRKPLPYLLQQTWFMGLPFYVDERVLIPRSPFAEWIECQFSPWIEPHQVQRILDIGTGSACMAIAAARMFPLAEIDAVDISLDALAVAAENVRRHDVVERVHLLKSDCYQVLEGVRYDIIMANPPYVGATEMETLPAEYRHEPRLALEAEDDGLAIADRILRGAAEHLVENGILVLEVGNSDELLIERYPRLPFIWLEQTSGGHGLCVLNKVDLLTFIKKE